MEQKFGVVLACEELESGAARRARQMKDAAALWGSPCDCEKLLRTGCGQHSGTATRIRLARYK